MPNPSQRGASLLRALGFLLQFATVGLALAFVVTRLLPERFAPPAPAAPVAVPSGPASYREAVARAAPSVVNIYTRIMVAEPAYQIFADPTFQRFSGITLVPQRVPRRGLGSGVIVRADGYVLTNHHVIAGAQDILVGLSDGRITPASVVGTDRDTDLAVLRIEGSNLPAATPAPADQALAVGDVVLAIGNPLGIGQTVTIGIVSATGRNQLSLSRYEDFIQTDAAVNVGNSGGALVNARGDLVGINTSVFGRERGVQGISFAIPASAAGRVLEQIIEHGHVIRGWMGTEYADTAQSASPVSDGLLRGVQLVTAVPGGPADQAGLRPGDILRRFNNAEILDASDLHNAESLLAPGTTVRVEGERAGVPLDVQLTLVERPAASR